MWSKIEKKFWEDKWVLHPLTGFFQCLFVSSSQQSFLGSADITLGSWPFWLLQVACSHHHYTPRYNNAELLSVWITRKRRHLMEALPGSCYLCSTSPSFCSFFQDVFISHLTSPIFSLLSLSPPSLRPPLSSLLLFYPFFILQQKLRKDRPRYLGSWPTMKLLPPWSWMFNGQHKNK